MNKFGAAAFVFSTLLVVLGPTAVAQFTFSNYLETRVGKDPNDPFPNVPDNRLTRFDQFNLDYFQDNLLLGLRFEAYIPSNNQLLEFSKLTRRYAGWTSERIDMQVGNYEALFGRGLVLRAFDLAGIVREEVGTPQFGDSRDLDGIKLQYHKSRYRATFLSGKPRRAGDPPTRDRNGSVTGGEVRIRLVHGVQAGGEYLRLDSQSSGPGSTIEASGGFVAVNPDSWLRRAGINRLSLGSYVEYVRATGLALPRAASSSKVEPDKGRALYVMQNLFIDDFLPDLRLAMSLEYKNYQNFELGVNEPPPLVREHTYILLNRSTHVLQATQEEGYQLESRLHYRSDVDLTLNWSRAENRDSKQFKEFYTELAGHYRGRKWTLFGASSQDPSESLFDSETIGTYALLPVLGPHSLELEYEQMTGFRRSGGTDIPFKDNYASITYGWAGSFSLAATRQTTDDPREAEDPITGETSRLSFSSLSGSFRIASHHELIAFWGRRRSGLQCTAGTCYLVRAFDGVIVQLVSRF